MTLETTRQYYEAELAYLRELGEVFARANPDVAPLLGRRASDPDVERLMEGFAFLTGRLRQRMEEHLPDLAQGLLHMLWPHYLRPVPALTILRFDPPATGGATEIPAGAQVRSRPVDGVTCRFRTCHALPLVPARVAALALEERATSATLTLTLEATEGGSAADLARRPIRLFLHGGRDAEPGPQILFALLQQCVGASAGDGTVALPVDPARLRHAGHDEAVLPWPGNAFPGYRIMQEYMLFPGAGLFAELPPVPGAERLSGASLTWTFRLDRRAGMPVRPGPEHVHLNCVPAINLYEAAGRPLLPDAGHFEQRVSLLGQHEAARVYSVDDAEGRVQGKAERVRFPDFASYAHARPGEAGMFRVVRLRPAVHGRGTDPWISFVAGDGSTLLPAVDAISLSLTGTDGEVAARVPIGGLDIPGPGCVPGLGVRNIVPVTQEATPPLGGDMMWRLVAGLSRALQPLTDVPSLRALLSAYALRALTEEPERQRLLLMLDALRAVEVRPLATLVKGVPVHGRELRLSVAESGFGGIAGAWLFGTAVDAFIGTRAGLNACWQMVLLGVDSRREMRWPVRIGRAPVA